MSSAPRDTTPSTVFNKPDAKPAPTDVYHAAAGRYCGAGIDADYVLACDPQVGSNILFEGVYLLSHAKVAILNKHLPDGICFFHTDY